MEQAYPYGFPHVQAPRRVSSAEAILAVGALLWGVVLIVIFLQAPLYSGVSSPAVQATITETCTGDAHSQTCSGSGSAGAPVDPGTGGTESATQTYATATLTDINGRWVLAYAIGPLLMVVIICIVLWERPVARGPGAIAWIAMGLLGAFTLLAMMSIGIFILPLTGAAVALCVVRQSRAAALARGRYLGTPGGTAR